MHTCKKYAYLTIGIISLIFSPLANALQVPKASKLDSRIQYMSYSADDVFSINASNGYITTVVFAIGENVINYGSGYSTAWEFATSDNQFFMKPRAKDGTTNLVIVTNYRIYNFDVHLVDNPKNATYKLTFVYPSYENAKNEEQIEQDLLEKLINAPDINIDTNPHLKNCEYTMNFGETENSRLIAPIQVFDDGLFTYMKFRSNTDFPAVYRTTTEGESIINTHIEEDTLIVHGVYPEYRLRAGSDVVGLYNEGYSKLSNQISARFQMSDATGSSVPGVYRSLKE